MLTFIISQQRALSDLLYFLFFYVFKIFSNFNKKPKINVNNEFIDELVLNYGGIDNILSVEIENARLKITVFDLDLVNLEKLKTLAESGIFVTGNTVKSLYKLNSEQIKKSLESRLNK